jgi:hypothetical protein
MVTRMAPQRQVDERWVEKEEGEWEFGLPENLDGEVDMFVARRRKGTWEL